MPTPNKTYPLIDFLCSFFALLSERIPIGTAATGENISINTKIISAGPGGPPTGDRSPPTSNSFTTVSVFPSLLKLLPVLHYLHKSCL